MAVEDDINALQANDATQNGAITQLQTNDADKEDRISELETFQNLAEARLQTLEEDRRALKKDYPYKALHIPFYTAADEVDLADYANVSIPTDYGSLTLRADPDYEFAGYTVTLEVGAVIDLTIKDSTGNSVVAASAFGSAGVYLLKRIDTEWKVSLIGGVFVQA